ncbi:hypothetical protein, partial [Nitrosomonas sp. JL21]|uniref:hypothetical protein n=1 Tax=Nitrosomonas sp. JL21 TaxID=153949 RepID=UPI001962156F
NILHGFLFFGNSKQNPCDFHYDNQNIESIVRLENLIMNDHLVQRALKKRNQQRSGKAESDKRGLDVMNEYVESNFSAVTRVQ